MAWIDVLSSAQRECDFCHKEKFIAYIKKDSHDTVLEICKDCLAHAIKMMEDIGR